MKTIQVEAVLTADEAIGVTINQYLFATGVSRLIAGKSIGVSGPSMSRKLKGHTTWTATELLMFARAFGLQVSDLTPTWDENQGWIPAPFVPGKAKAPDFSEASTNIVRHGGLEPSTR